MSLIAKYLTREIFKSFVILLAMVVGIFLLVDFFERIDDFMEAGLSFFKAITFFQLKIPFIVSQVAPIGVFLAVIIVFGLMNKHNEIIALQSSGVSMYYLLRPALFIGFFLSILVFLLSELIVPMTISKANNIWNVEVKKRSAVVSKGKNIWIKDNRAIYHITYYNPANQTILGVSLNFFDDEFRLTQRVDAKKGVFTKGRWVFYDIMELKLDIVSNHYEYAYHREKEEPFQLLPEEIQRVVKRSEEMSFFELLEFIKNIETEGYDASVYKVDLHAKLAFPFVCLIMCLMGPCIASRRKLRESLSVSIFCGICIAFIYWILYSFSLSIGYGEMVPPIMAAWIANVVFFSFAVFAFLKS